MIFYKTNMKEDNEDFKEGLKTTSLFGGVQIFKIFISIISAKFVALLLGPTGMGISGLLSSTTGLIGAATNLGLSTSAVRDVSLSYAAGDKYHFSRTVSIFRRLVWGTGLLGLLVCLVLSPFWSNLTFGNYDYTLAFALLSITFLLGQISSGQGVVLQGTRNFKMMAKSGIIGSVIGLFTSIPLFYFWGNEGIVPAMLLSSITGLLLTTYYARKVKIRTDIRRGEDGSLALSLKPYGKIAFLYNREARPVTGYGTIGSQSLWQSFVQHAKYQGKGLSRIFFKKDHYEDQEDNLVKPVK